MRVFGLATDPRSSWTTPFPRDGDGGAFLAILVIVFSVFASILLPLLFAPLAALVAVFMLAGGCVKVRLLGGDRFDPVKASRVLRPGVAAGTPADWFNSIPAEVVRAFYRVPRVLFLAIGIGRFGAYGGGKVFGVDSPAYLDYPGVTREDVFGGSLAFCYSLRFSGARPR